MTALDSDVVAWDAKTAAAKAGVSVRTLTDAHDRGDLVGYWLGTKRLYEPEEVRAWVRSLPTTKPERRAS